MKIELLPNEILIECLKYLNTFDIFHSFDQLNNRLNNLLRCLPLYINMDNVKKSMFDEFCTKMLLNPEIKNQVYRLKLLDDCQCLINNIFLSFFSLNEFVHLEKFESTLPLSSSFKQHLQIEFTDLFFSKIQTLSISKLNWFRWPTNKISSIINLILSECELNNSYQLLEYIPMLKYLYILKISFVKRQKLLKILLIINIIFI